MNQPNFPQFPRNNEEIRSFSRPGEYMACAIVHRCDIRQLMAFRELRLAFRDNQEFLDALVEALDILHHATTIRKPAGWLYAFLRDEANARKGRGGRQ